MEKMQIILFAAGAAALGVAGMYFWLVKTATTKKDEPKKVDEEINENLEEEWEKD